MSDWGRNTQLECALAGLDQSAVRRSRCSAVAVGSIHRPPVCRYAGNLPKGACRMVQRILRSMFAVESTDGNQRRRRT